MVHFIKIHENEHLDSGLENREYGRRDPSRWPRGNLYPQKFAITSPTNGGRSVGIVRSRTQATEFSFTFLVQLYWMKASVGAVSTCEFISVPWALNFF
jgi:hypothetical protein